LRSILVVEPQMTAMTGTEWTTRYPQVNRGYQNIQHIWPSNVNCKTCCDIFLSWWTVYWVHLVAYASVLSEIFFRGS
jgi:hypothetical protein